MADIIDFKTRRHLKIADELQRIALSGPEAAECQRIMNKHRADETISEMIRRESGVICTGLELQALAKEVK